MSLYDHSNERCWRICEAVSQGAPCSCRNRNRKRPCEIIERLAKKSVNIETAVFKHKQLQARYEYDLDYGEPRK